jgi:hypothetical protein
MAGKMAMEYPLEKTFSTLKVLVILEVVGRTLD